MRGAIVAVIALLLVAAVTVVAFLPQKAEQPSDTTPETVTDGVVVYNPYSTDGQWYKGQMHCHSKKSDGALSPQDVVERYASLGYDFIALTDHYGVTKVTGSILVIGQEYGKGSTESTSATHMNGMNITYYPDSDATEQQRIDNITAQGGIVSLNHPSFYKYAYDHSTLVNLTGYTCLEIANGKAGYVAMTTIGWWDEALTAGKHVWGLAADDAHVAEDYDKAWIVVKCHDLTTDGVIDAVRAGSFYASTGTVIDDVVVDGSNLTVTSSNGNHIRFFGSEGKLLASVNGSQATYHFDGTEGYVRAVVGSSGGWGWTQPVFVDDGT